jgi:hypothetical protein
MEQGTKQLLLNIMTNITSLQFLFNPLSIELHENVEAIPKIGYLWLLVAVVSPHHQVRFFFLGIDVLFTIGDKVVKVEHIELNLNFWCGDWEERMMENGYVILNTRRRCIMKHINFQLELTL